MSESIKNFWDGMSSGVKMILFFLAIATSFSSGQLIINPQVKANREMAVENKVVSEDNKHKLDVMTKNVEFLTQVTVATARTAGVDTEEIRRKVDAEFRQLQALSK